MPPLDERKAAEAAVYLLEKAGGALPHQTLSSLMYLSERESYRRYGEPLTGDILVALPFGPALQRLNSFFLGAVLPSRATVLADLIQARGFQVASRRAWTQAARSMSRLSESDFEVLDLVWAQFGLMARPELTKYTREHCSEWTDPHGSEKLIPLPTLLRHLGFANDVIEDILQHLSEQAQIERSFASAKALGEY